MEEPTDYHLGRITLNNLKKCKDDVHQVELSSDEVETHEDVRIRSVRVAQALKTRGVGVGDLLIVCADSHNDACIPIIASFYIGSAVLPLSSTLSKNELKRLLTLGNVKIIFCDPCMEDKFTKALEELDQNLEIVVFGDVSQNDGCSQRVTPFSEFLSPTGTEDDFDVTDVNPETTAIVLCSSGSTGLPKGICLPHKVLSSPRYMMDGFKATYIKRGEGYFLTFSSCYWVSGVINLTLTLVFGIPRIICAAPFSVELLDKGLKKYKPSIVMLSPVAVQQTLKSEIFEEMDFSSLSSLLIGGSILHTDALNKIKAKITNGLVTYGYGSTEGGLYSVGIGDIASGSVGKIYSYIKWKLVDVETRKEVETGTVGELFIKHEQMFKEYLNSPETTESAFDEDGYFMTGDLLRCDEDGHMFFVDRCKEVIKFRNYQVTPAEVELEISNLSGVLHVCVVGKKHLEDGELPMAFVQKKQGSIITEQDIHNIVNETLADHKKLRGGVIFIEEMPTTVSGKIRRGYIKEMAQTS